MAKCPRSVPAESPAESTAGIPQRILHPCAQPQRIPQRAHNFQIHGTFRRSADGWANHDWGPGGDPKNKEQQTWAWENEEKQWNDWSRSSCPLLSGSGAVALFLQNLRPFRREVKSGRYRLPRNGAQSCASANVPNEFPQLCMRVVFSRRKASQPALSHRGLDPSQILFEG